jgi:type II restriction enzyme
VDWIKIKKNIKKIEIELNILNYLIGKEDIEKEFLKLIKEYPNIKRVLPIIIAVRESKLKNFNIITDMDNLISENISDIFNPSKSFINEDRILEFFIKSGLKSIFKDKQIKNLVDYCYGVEVGLDTNARKNRTGILMENIVKKFIEDFSKKFNIKYLSQVTKTDIEINFQFPIIVDRYDRKFDFGLFNNLKNKLYLLEVNYYSGGGSKLKSTAGEYQDVYKLLKKQNIYFIWITDGIGWLTSKNPLFEAFQELDYIFNLELLFSNVLNEIIL